MNTRKIEITTFVDDHIGKKVWCSIDVPANLTDEEIKAGFERGEYYHAIEQAIEKGDFKNTEYSVGYYPVMEMREVNNEP